MTLGEFSRRCFLRRSSAAVLATGLAGCNSRESNEDPNKQDNVSEADKQNSQAGISNYADRFDTIVNIVEAGGDNTGQEVINDTLLNAIGDDTLIYFPSGEYKLDEFSFGRCRNIGFVSLPNDESVITPASPGSEMSSFINIWGVSDLLFKGLNFDFTSPGFGGVIKLIARGDLIARDLKIRGKLPDTNTDEKHVAFRVDVRDADSKGLVEQLIAKDGGHEGGNGVGVFVGKDHAGTLLFRNCKISNFPNNGLYASAPGRDSPNYKGAGGKVHVRGGIYKNNNIANVRVGSAGSTVKNTAVVVDNVPPHESKRDLNVRGVRLRSGEGQVVENCYIFFGRNAGPGFGAISYHPQHGSSTVRDTEIRIERDNYCAISATDASNGGTRAPLHFENVSITGSASGGFAIGIADRDKTSFRNCKIKQFGYNRDGILFQRSRDCLVGDTTILVTGMPVTTKEATVQRSNLNATQL